MKLIIDIDDNEYISIKEYPNNITSYPITIHIYDAIRNGTPFEEEFEKIIEYAEKSMILRDNVYDNTTEYSVSMRDLINIIRKRISELKGENK